MKKIAALCIGVGCMLTVTGCGSNVTLNTEQNDMVSEYIAGVLLKHSYENQWEYEKLAAAKKQSESKNNNKNHTAHKYCTADDPACNPVFCHDCNNSCTESFFNGISNTVNSRRNKSSDFL